MKYCDECRVEIRGDLERCPLCYNELSGTAEPSVFPRNKAKESGTFALRVLAGATGVGLLVMLLLWQRDILPGDITLVVCLALIINYLFVQNILTHRPDFLRVINRYFLVLLAVALVWFLLTQNHIVTTFVIPAICLAALVSDAVLIAVFRGTFVSGYAKYLLFNVFFGLTPLILVALRLTDWSVPAYISASVSCVLLLGLLLFARKQLLSEIRKLFSM